MRAGLPNQEILQNSGSRTKRDPRNAKIGPPMYGDRTWKSANYPGRLVLLWKFANDPGGLLLPLEVHQ